MIGLMYWVPAAVFVALLVMHHDDLGIVAVGVYVVLAALGGIVILGLVRMPVVVFLAWISFLALVLYFHVKFSALNL